jgi:hypothetical protein
MVPIAAAAAAAASALAASAALPREPEVSALDFSVGFDILLGGEPE